MTNEEKQIEEIKTLNLLLEDITVDKVLFTSDGEAIDVITVNAVEPTVTNQLANTLYAKGYRKASNVAREIFAEIEKHRYTFIYPQFTANGILIDKSDCNIHITTEDYYAIKKKYESEGGE